MISELKNILEDLGRKDAQDGDCVEVSTQIYNRLKEHGFNSKIKVFFAYLDENLLSFAHQVVLFDDLIIDGAIIQYDKTLPSLVIMKISNYEKLWTDKGIFKIKFYGV